MRIGFDLSISDFDRELYTTLKTVLEKREGESPVHILMKMLGAALFFHERMEIEPNDADQQYRPDVLVRDLTGAPTLWVECGQVKTSKLDKLTTRYADTRFIVIKRLAREVDALYERALKEVRRPYKIEYRAFELDFADKVARHIMGKNTLDVLRSERDIQCIINDHRYTSALYIRKHDRPGYAGKSYD